MRLHVVGGFLGAGKTTLVRALARELRTRGERVAVITNDQGSSLVDTSLCNGDADSVREIPGGCFCCRYDDLEAALVAAAAGGATYSIAEAVGSCTDLVATVLAPLADRAAVRIEMAPLAIVVDPWRVLEIERGASPPDIAYLFRKQIEEADVVLLSRSDLAPPDVTAAIKSIRADAAVVAVSGRTGAGLDAWLAAAPVRPAAPLEIDYERYGAAEALLGWANGIAHVQGIAAFSPALVMERFLEGLRDEPIAHVKLVSLEPAGGRGALVRRGDAPNLDVSALPAQVEQARWIVNARVRLDPETLGPRIRDAFLRAAAPARVTWESFECFRPSAPVPTHRYARRAQACDDASCCAAFYGRPDVRLLLGDSWHPGGTDLTLRLAERLALREGSVVVDVACGDGTSLRALRAARPVAGIGIDASLRPSSNDSLDFRVGDAHALPVTDASADAVLCECALSTFVDPSRALGEMHRALRPGGRLGLTDMVVNGRVPESLQDWVSVGTCLARARSMSGYADLIESSGFRIVERWDASDALRELLARIRRNLVGAALAAKTGQLPAGVRIDVKEARDAVRAAEQAITDGVLSYGAFIAERRE